MKFSLIHFLGQTNNEINTFSTEGGSVTFS